MIDFMEIAKKQAILAMEKGEIPVGAVIVKDGVVIAKAHNLKETLNDTTAHAEILAIRKASKFLGDWRLNGTEMYVTLEPCPMCASAIVQSRISKLYIGTFNKDMGACGSTINILDNRRLNSFVNVKWTYDDECSDLLVEFFDKRRKQ
ncbi:nucleoside deaminase [Clostridium saccharobutylicum]|uniref:tRNA-specific adenosine deaminase n=1 Tax=Clostridium saccharobutylicum DSM 13864 TaxID=1345695 RepID=U5N0A2_CLOSA|nr:nucleoside deaminase [Clostridium saccharobutylicum]AGX45361.1 tRNA-specific adenosine deaminase TadA [Clostridium saccharobutylicum DSM 13864]AQR92637.1 tRNA-specific adenosine deaminase [Clostridium saccharobutylicum]AQS02539.1 tRNA-specific adenosine deaminase [Clostridium saccharobutylicum]AQS12144.1 tRNA-specific adenosine deaminase [Clostridium saccharobutylicum]AQS16522.1 tRNA-specific adenosine deaminase [Clostridium saccharobutylicum]